MLREVKCWSGECETRNEVKSSRTEAPAVRRWTTALLPRDGAFLLPPSTVPPQQKPTEAPRETVATISLCAFSPPPPPRAACPCRVCAFFGPACFFSFFFPCPRGPRRHSSPIISHSSLTTNASRGFLSLNSKRKALRRTGRHRRGPTPSSPAHSRRSKNAWMTAPLS